MTISIKEAGNEWIQSNKRYRVNFFHTRRGNATAAGKIRIGVQPIPPDAVLMARNWLKPYGVEAKISEFSSGGELMQAFIDGNLDIADGGSSRLVTLAASRPNLFYIMVVRQSSSATVTA